MSNFVVEAVISSVEAKGEGLEVQLKGTPSNFFVEHNEKKYNLFWPDDKKADKSKPIVLETSEMIETDKNLHELINGIFLNRSQAVFTIEKKTSYIIKAISFKAQ